MDEKKFYTCRNDRAFKEVFLKEENKDLLKALLESILPIKIEEIVYFNLEKNSDNIYFKRKHFDLHIKTEKENIQIEVNSEVRDYVRPRNFSYICSTYSHEVLTGEDYSEDTMFIQINFTYGLGKGKKDLRIYQIQDTEEEKYVNNFFIYEFNMDYYMSLWYSNDEKGIKDNKYLIMMDLKPNELEKLSKKDQVIHKYMSEVKRVNENPFYYEYMNAEEDNRKIENSLRKQFRREGLEEGRKEGIKEGIKEGEKQKNLENARTMKIEGIDYEVISRISGLSIEEIEKL